LGDAQAKTRKEVVDSAQKQSISHAQEKAEKSERGSQEEGQGELARAREAIDQETGAKEKGEAEKVASSRPRTDHSDRSV
jgi:hypothetical protein